jgi:hypothetical protein
MMAGKFFAGKKRADEGGVTEQSREQNELRTCPIRMMFGIDAAMAHVFFHPYPSQAKKPA